MLQVSVYSMKGTSQNIEASGLYLDYTYTEELFSKSYIDLTGS